MTLRLLKGSNKPKAYRGNEELIVCPNCQGSMFIKIVHMPMRRNMRWMKRSGHTSLECVSCKIEVANDI